MAQSKTFSFTNLDGLLIDVPVSQIDFIAEIEDHKKLTKIYIGEPTSSRKSVYYIREPLTAIIKKIRSV